MRNLIKDQGSQEDGEYDTAASYIAATAYAMMNSRKRRCGGGSKGPEQGSTDTRSVRSRTPDKTEPRDVCSRQGGEAI